MIASLLNPWLPALLAFLIHAGPWPGAAPSSGAALTSGVPAGPEASIGSGPAAAPPVTLPRLHPFDAGSGPSVARPDRASFGPRDAPRPPKGPRRPKERPTSKRPEDVTWGDLKRRFS